MPRVIQRALLGLGAFLVGACATPYASYQYLRGGYSEIELSPAIFEIRVAKWGLGLDFSLLRERDLALLRSAELTLRKGYRYFVVEGGECRESGLRRGFEGNWIACTIKIFSDRPNITDLSVLVYSAVEVQREMRSKVGLVPMP